MIRSNITRAIVAFSGTALALACGASSDSSTALSTGGSGGTPGAGGIPAATSGGNGGTVAGGGTASSVAGATGGSMSVTAGTGGLGGVSASGAAGMNGGSAGLAAGGGAGGSAGLTAAGGTGPTSCSGRSISLASNTTGDVVDTADALVAIDLGTDLPLGNADRTIEFWMYVKPTDWFAERNEIYVYGTVGTLQQVGLDFGAPAVIGMPNNHATLGPYTDGVYDDDTGVDLGLSSATSQWVHAAMTWDGASTTLRTYVNGALRITTTSADNTPLITTDSLFYLGCNPPYYGCFSGLVDELRIWNVRRSDAEIMTSFDKALVGNETGLVGYWKFDDMPGSLSAVDSVTTAGHTPHPGTLMAATPAEVPTFVSADPLPPVACP